MIKDLNPLKLSCTHSKVERIIYYEESQSQMILDVSNNKSMEKGSFKLSYKYSKIPFAILIPLVIAWMMSGGLFDKLGMTKDEILQILIEEIVVIAVTLIVTYLLTCVNHSIIFDEKGIVLKNGKEEEHLLWGKIRNIKLSEQGFKSIEIESSNESNQSKLHYIPLEFLLSSIEDYKKEELLTINEYITKFMPKSLEIFNESKSREYSTQVNSVSYTLQRKKFQPMYIIYLLVLSLFFFFFSWGAIMFLVAYSIIMIPSLNHGKEDAVFDAAGVTIYRKKELTFVSWKKIKQININKDDARTNIIFEYTDEENKTKKLKWQVESLFNTNGDIYDFFINVSPFRGKPVVDLYEKKKGASLFEN